MAGFIGYHCAARLLAEGHRVHGVDNLNDYYLPALKQHRLDKLRSMGEVGFSQVDIADREALEAVFRPFEPEAVLNLAAQAGVRYSLINPYAYIRANIDGMLNVLELCRHRGKPRLVYASSSSVYGGNERLPFAESDRVDTPVSLYAATKKADELMAHTYTHLYGLQTIGLRFFTVYGPMGRPDMAMWLFTDAIQHGRPIKVFNNGDMQRDFTYVDDIVAGVVASLTKDTLDDYEVFNLGNHRSEPLMRLISLIEQGLGREAEKIMMPMQDGDVQATYADISRARAKLGFAPATALEDGVPRFIEWFSAHPEFHGTDTVK
jgi:UDP-glucuronate 4-epimerase